jgi:hypothetical protein
MTLSTNLERLNGGTTDGCVATGLHREIIQSVGATRTLKAEESGALCVFDAADGVVFTLPEAAEGMYFDFFVKTTITSNAAKVITNSAAEFISGAISFAGDASTTLTNVISAFAADGATHVAISSNGTTTGGKAGTRFRLTAISSTIWAIDGVVVGSGTVATPFATS